MAITRRSALWAIGGLAATPMLGAASGAGAASSQGLADAPATVDGLPRTGQLLPGLEFLDQIVPQVIANHGLAGVSVAVAKDGKLKAARGYGLAIIENGQPMRPTSLLCLGSVSKVITAQTILKLVGEGQLSLNDSAYGFFPELRVVPGMQKDTHLPEVTVQRLLHHSGGWTGDQSNWGPRIMRQMHLEGPPTVMDLVRYMMGVPLDYRPGSKTVYSNFGYVLLGAIIMKLAQQPYPRAVHELMLGPLGVQRMQMDGPPPDYVAGEAHRYQAGNLQPYDGGHTQMANPAGGWLADAVEMAWVMTAIDGSRTGSPFLPPPMVQAMLSPPPGLPVRENGTYFGMGWNDVRPVQAGAVMMGDDPFAAFEYSKPGGLPGISTWVEHLANGVDWAVLVNSSTPHKSQGEHQEEPVAILHSRLVPQFRSLPEWPDGDLFGDFRGDVS